MITLLGTEHHNLGMDACTFLINGQRYRYELHRNLLRRVEWLARFRPGAALDMAKKSGKLINQKGKK